MSDLSVSVSPPAPPRARLASVLLIVAGVLAASAMVWRASNAAFTATTTNGSNTFSTGTVALSDSDNSTSMFTTPPLLAPGATGSACIRVTYGGNLPSAVKLYTTGLSDAQGLGTYITMIIDEGTTSPANAPGVFDCTNFTSQGNLAIATVAQLGTHTDFANGYGTWAPTGPGQTKDYRFWWVLSGSAPDSVQNATVSLGFVWEAQST